MISAAQIWQMDPATACILCCQCLDAEYGTVNGAVYLARWEAGDEYYCKPPDGSVMGFVGWRADVLSNSLSCSQGFTVGQCINSEH